MAELSQRERITQYAQDTFGTEAEYLWGDIPDGAVFRHPPVENGTPSLWGYPEAGLVFQERKLPMF